MVNENHKCIKAKSTKEAHRGLFPHWNLMIQELDNEGAQLLIYFENFWICIWSKYGEISYTKNFENSLDLIEVKFLVVNHDNVDTVAFKKDI